MCEQIAHVGADLPDHTELDLWLAARALELLETGHDHGRVELGSGRGPELPTSGLARKRGAVAAIDGCRKSTASRHGF